MPGLARQVTVWPAKAIVVQLFAALASLSLIGVAALPVVPAARMSLTAIAELTRAAPVTLSVIAIA
jgi:hypothetical protein